MMKLCMVRSLSTFLAMVVLSACSSAAAKPGQPAPDFTLTDSSGKQHKLSEYRGKLVVLEWLNYDCPYVRKHYDTKNMQSLQQKYTGEGVVWLAVVSSAAGKQGHFSNEEHQRLKQEKGSHASAVLIDADGKVGKLYGASNTPQMVVVTKDGVLAYNGAIDDKPTARKEDVQGANNYLVAALEEVKAGKAVTRASTQPYGCSVKY
jgi:peroxiredoxin